MEREFSQAEKLQAEQFAQELDEQKRKSRGLSRSKTGRLHRQRSQSRMPSMPDVVVDDDLDLHDD
jgi:hypothetical protein